MNQTQNASRLADLHLTKLSLVIQRDDLHRRIAVVDAAIQRALEAARDIPVPFHPDPRVAASFAGMDDTADWSAGVAA